jgi:hypothetical protein
VGGVKAFLTKTGPFGLPVYAYVGGAVALIGGIWYFKTHNTGNATVAPQTNANPVTDAITPPPVVPFPSGTGTPVPPSPTFTTPGVGSASTTALPTSTANFIPTVPVATTSQQFAGSVAPSIVGPAPIADSSTATLAAKENIYLQTAARTGNYGPVSDLTRAQPVPPSIPVATPPQVAAIVKAVAKVPIIGRIITRIATPPTVAIPTGGTAVGGRFGGAQQ